MQITVCVAVTPATDTKIKIGADGKSIDREDVKSALNPFDDFAVEEAIRIVEKLGEGEVEVVTVGDGTQKEELRKCLARGAHKATILKADTSAADSRAIALALADHIRGGDSQIAFLGKQAVDFDNSQVPAHLAVALDWPVVSKISKLELDGNAFVAHREIEGGMEQVAGTLPCVFSAEKGLNEPRYPALKGIMAAKKKPLEEKEIELADSLLVIDKLELPEARPEGRIIGEGAGTAQELVDLLKNEAKVI